MKNTIIIRSVIGTQGGHLKCEGIRYKGQIYIITQDQRVVLKRDALPGDIPLYIKVTPQNTYTFNYNDGHETDGQNSQRKLMAEIIRYHHQMTTVEGMKYYSDQGRQIDYNPNATSGQLFDYENLAYSSMKNVDVLMMDIDAQNKVRNMSFAEKSSAMYFYGGNPQGMDHSELLMRLADPMGIVRQRVLFGSTGKTFLEHFVTEYKESDPLYVLKTAIIKAMNLTINGRIAITKAGAALMYEGKILGNTIEDAALWFMDNTEQKNYLIRMISEVDVLGLDDLDKAYTDVEEGNEAAAIIQNTMDEKEIRAKAKLLWIPNHWNGKLATLVEMIPEAEKLWANVDSLGLQSQVDKLKGKSYDELKKLVERKLEDANLVS